MTQTDWQARWRTAPLDWSPAWRVIPTRFPAVNLFDRVASEEDFDALYALEALTNDRLRTETGELDLVPRDERRFGVVCGDPRSARAGCRRVEAGTADRSGSTRDITCSASSS